MHLPTVFFLILKKKNIFFCIQVAQKGNIYQTPIHKGSTLDSYF